MLIDRLCPGLVPAIRQAFEVEIPGRFDIVVHALIQFGDYSMALGFIGALFLGVVCWIARDVVAFVLRDLAYRKKHAD